MCVCVCVCVYPSVPADISVGAKIGTGDKCLISLTPRSRPQACIIHVNVRHQSICVRYGGVTAVSTRTRVFRGVTHCRSVCAFVYKG